MNSDRFGALSRNLARTRSRRQVIAVLGGGLVAALLGSGRSDVAAQGNAQAARDCQQGGYATRVRGDGPRVGYGFATVGECVSYVTQGGTLQSGTQGSGGLGAVNPCATALSYDPATRLPSLSGLNLGPCNLGGPHDFSGANLSYASLINGYLPGVNLTGADLTGANLYRANLNSVILHDAMLVNANLNNADLAYADLSGADLTGAILDNVIWASTTCPDGTNSDANGGTCLGHL